MRDKSPTTHDGSGTYFTVRGPTVPTESEKVTLETRGASPTCITD